MPPIPSKPIKPFWTTRDGEFVKLYHGNVIDVLKKLPSQSVHCCVTSPPYWGLRSYLANDHDAKSLEIGSERTPEEFVQKMVQVFRELRRVLHDSGVLWLNLGDTYGGGGNIIGTNVGGDSGKGKILKESYDGMKKSVSGLKPGNLVGIPWRVALALQADGWVLRQDIIWAKPSPMPESVTNRCTKSHEYIFLFSKKQGYFYDAFAIREDNVSTYASEDFLPDSEKDQHGSNTAATGASRSNRSPEMVSNGRNKRSVWNVPSQGYSGAHFATFPPKLIEPCILAGSSEYGCCPDCMNPYRRVLSKEQLTRERPNDYVKRTGEEGTGSSCSNSVAGVSVKTLGWEKTCDCETTDVIPCTVIDPFIGSGTSCCVSVDHGRRSIGVDLSEKYLTENAIPRIEGELIAHPALHGMLPRVIQKMELGKTL